MSGHDYSPFDWDITSWRYASGEFHVSFHDGSSGSIAVSDFPALSGAPDAVLLQVKSCPWYVALRNDAIEWEISEAELYGCVNGQTARNQAQQKYLQLRERKLKSA